MNIKKLDSERLEKIRTGRKNDADIQFLIGQIRFLVEDIMLLCNVCTKICKEHPQAKRIIKNDLDGFFTQMYIDLGTD